MSTSNAKQRFGVYFGEREGAANTILRLFGVDRSVVKSIGEDGHIAICGGSGSGKTSGIVLPTLYHTWNGHFFSIDIKGDLIANYEKATPDSNAKVFSLRGETAFTYDPFDFVR